MTAECGGGTSSPKSGLEDPLHFTASAIAAFFNAIPSPWLFDFASYIAPQNVDPATFCAVDPPADPGMTAVDFANLLNFGAFALQLEAEAKLAQLFRRYLWFAICQCDADPQPTQPAAPTPPSGIVLVNPPAVSTDYPTGQPCLQFAFSLDGPANTNTIEATALTPLPSGATYASVDVVDDGRVLSGAEVYSSAMIFYNATTQVGTLTAGRTASTNTPHIEGGIPAGAIQYNMQRRIALGSGAPGHADSTFNWYCGTTPSGGGAVPIPCPPDPIVQGMLAQILGLVTLIQRQAVPFAYISSTAHGGLTGSGEFAVQGLIGARVDVDALGYGADSEAGDPEALFGVGWINWGNADGFKRMENISSSPMISLPRAAGQYTRIGYSLRPGAEVTITELVREA
jgi:hypothetical protein